MYEVQHELAQIFPGYLTAESSEAWERLKVELLPGSQVSGRVVARYIFGLFVDVGVSFPALLPVTHFHPSPKTRPVTIEEYPEIGSTIEGRVVSFNDRTRQIGLTQRPYRSYLDGRQRV